MLSRARFSAFVAGWGTGKTMCAIAKGMALTEQYPNNLGLIVRKSFRDLSDSTMNDFTKYTGKKIPSNKDIVFDNGSKIMFRYVDELAGSTQNLNLGWFYIEQAEELDSDKEFELLGGRLRRQGCFCQGFIIANTNGHNWIWRKWKNKGGSDYMCDILYDPETGIKDVRYSGFASLTEATLFDNIKNLPPAFVAANEVKKATSPALYRRCVMNSWEDTDMTDEVISYKLIREAINRELLNFSTPPRVVSCDPAEMGEDHTIIYAFEGGKLVDEEVTSKKEPMDTAGRILRMGKKWSAQLTVVDADGLGSPIVSRLSELGVNVLGIKAGKNADEKDDFRNIKAEMWINARDMFTDGLVSIPDDEMLVEDLAVHTYTLNSKGQVLICKKDDVKKKLNRSPDKGDALVLGLWGVSKCPKEERFEEEESDSELAKSYTSKTVFK